MAGPERIHDWLAESSMAFSAISDFPFGHTTLHDLTMADEDEDFMQDSDEDDASFEDDHEEDMPYSATAANFPRQPGTVTVHRTRDSASVQQLHATVKDTQKRPSANDTNQPFLYSGRLMLVALPGLALVISVAGDLLITVATVGAILVYLLHIAGVQQRSMTAYICTFVCCQIIIIYSALPLLWHTMLNVFLIGVLNCFAILTGAWGLLFFESFRSSEPELTRMIEMCLFGLYPAINVILVTWIIGSGISPAVAPYGLLGIGFMVLQLFMTPTPSSFNKPNVKEVNMLYVLDTSAVGAMALAYTALPPAVYTYLTIVTTKTRLFSLYFMVELVFLGCLSTFLATLMNLREFLEIAGVEYRHLVRCRWVFGLTALLLLSAVLHKYGFSSSLLPWLTLGLALHTGYGFFSRRRQYRMRSAVAAMVLCCLYAFIFAKLPWKLDLRLEGTGLHINTAQALLFLNTLLCVACVYAATNFRTATLGWLVTLQTLSLVVAEKLLWTGRHYLTHLLVLSAVVAIYFILRLYHANKLAWQPACVCIALHLTKLNNCCDVTVHRRPGSAGAMLYTDACTLLLGLFFSRTMLFDKGAITFIKWLAYMVVALAVLSLSMPGLLTDAFTVVFGSEPSFSELAGVTLLLSAAVSVKLSLQTGATAGASPSATPGRLGLNHVGPTAVVMAVVLFHLKPEPVLVWEEVNKWLVILNLVSCFFLVPLASLTKLTLPLSLIGLFLGMPLGVSVAVWVQPEEVDAFALGVCGVMTSSIVCFALFVWRRVPSLETKLLVLLGVLAAGTGALFTVGDAEIASETPSPCLLAATTSTTLIALILKLHSHRENYVDLTAEVYPVNHPALIGNISSITAYLLLCFCCPTKLWEIWCIITSSVLLLLQRDHLYMRHLSRRNNAAPMIIVTTLVMWVSTWWNSSAFSPAASLLHTLSGAIELGLVWAAAPPLYAVFFTVLWQDRFYLSDRVVVFVTPANLFLFIFGSTFQAWAFAFYGIAVGGWLIVYKLPLKPDES